MPLDSDRKYNDAQRREYLNLTDRVGMNWLQVFEGDQDFYSAAYWDLFAGIWRAGEPLRKTEALGLMKGIKSIHTAGKYLETAITRGMVVETDNPRTRAPSWSGYRPRCENAWTDFSTPPSARSGNPAARSRKRGRCPRSRRVRSFQISTIWNV